MTVVAGVDGGGTLTRVVVVDASGAELGRAEGPGAVVNPGAPEAAVRAVAEAVRAAANKAGVPLPIDFLWAGLAGAGAPGPRAAVTRSLSGLDLSDGVVVGTDVEAAFHDAFGSGPGVLIIAGTGSVAWARGPSGEAVRVGGWGDKLGDEGSGFEIGLQALRAVARAHDGRGPATSLIAGVLARLGLVDAEALIPWAATAGKRDVAALVPVVVDADTAGDPVARGILSAAVEALRSHLEAVVQRAGPWTEPPELVLCGGLLQEGGPLGCFAAALAEGLPVRPEGRRIDPAMGAARLALRAVSEGP